MGLQQSTTRADCQGGNLYRTVREIIGNVEQDDNPSDSSNSRVSGAVFTQLLLMYVYPDFVCVHNIQNSCKAHPQRLDTEPFASVSNILEVLWRKVRSKSDIPQKKQL
jgi:hypothetical protein